MINSLTLELVLESQPDLSDETECGNANLISFQSVNPTMVKCLVNKLAEHVSFLKLFRVLDA